MFELSQLRCFVAAAEELHFGRAAERLHMTQPPLSRQIQILERVLGVQLMERTSRVVRLTRAGRTFLPEARRILHLAESAALSTRRTAAGEAGSVAIGFTAAAGYRFLPELISTARERLPGVDFVLEEMVTAEQVEALASHRIDAAFLRPPVRREFESVRVMREPLLAALPADHRLAKGRLPTLKDFDLQPFVMYSPYEARYFYDLLAGVFAEAGVAPRYVQHMSQVHAILALVRAGLGAALVPAAAVSLRFDDIVLRPIAIRPARPVELFLAWERSNDNPVLPAFVDLARRSSRPGPERAAAPQARARPRARH
jgi:DNA-binding transcriptional LysR family regulator